MQVICLYFVTIWGYLGDVKKNFCENFWWYGIKVVLLQHEYVKENL